jgi:hypothetical protein
MQLDDRTGLPDAERSALERELRGQQTLADVIRWGLAQVPQAVVVDVVVQDEYTHDVLVPWRDRWLVYDAT